MNHYYFNVVVHGQVCNRVVVWNSHSGVLGQHSTWSEDTKGEIMVSAVTSVFVSSVIFWVLWVLTEILTELLHYFIKDNAVLKALQDKN